MAVCVSKLGGSSVPLSLLRPTHLGASASCTGSGSVACVGAARGGALVGIQLALSDGTPLAFAFLLWGMSRYLAYLLIALSLPRAGVIWLAGAPLLLADAWATWETFIVPGPSTSARALVFVPLWSLVLLLPVGVGIGWIASGLASRLLTGEGS